MTQLASRAQLNMSLLRWALVTVPVVLLLGFLSGAQSGSSGDSAWYRALAKPDLTPPGWLFPIAWTILYILMALAAAIILNARGARGRRAAVMLFLVQLALNLAWSPLFFGMHRIGAALGVLAAMWVAAVATTFAFGRIRPSAAWLMLPYLAWISYAGMLNASIWRMNPAALAAPAARVHI